MIKALTKRLLAKLGNAGFAEKLAKDPLNANLHLQYAFAASKRGIHDLAYAELKTARCLGADRGQVDKHARAFRSALPNQMQMAHNHYSRFKTLASEIITRGDKSSLSVLDVGGGHGALASFLPDDATYCLVEPTVNGISGTKLPFPDHSFDYVVACHVLEHIPVKVRALFLDQLISKARHGVILLNPFFVEGTHVEERLKLFIEITNASWAKEHLECSLPKVDDLKTYAAERRLLFDVKPNGTLTTTMAFVFLDHFAAKSGNKQDWKKINSFFNEHYTQMSDSAKYPTDYLIYLGWPEAKNR